MSAYSEYAKSTNNFFSCSKNYFFPLSKIGTEFGEIKTREDKVYKTIRVISQVYTEEKIEHKIKSSF